MNHISRARALIERAESIHEQRVIEKFFFLFFDDSAILRQMQELFEAPKNEIATEWITLDSLNEFVFLHRSSDMVDEEIRQGPYRPGIDYLIANGKVYISYQGMLSIIINKDSSTTSAARQCIEREITAVVSAISQQDWEGNESNN